jgi:hypothetical protein
VLPGRAAPLLKFALVMLYAEERMLGRQNQLKNRQLENIGKTLLTGERNLLLSNLSHTVNQEING